MKKTCVFLAGIVLLIFITYACEMPHSIKLKTDRFEMNAPVKLARFNIATVISEAFKSSFPEGFEIYDIINYPNNTLAFLVGYQMVLLESFNPDDYLKDLKSPEGMPSINESIIIPKMTSDTTAGAPILFDMHDFFDSMKTTINGDIKTQREVSSSPYELPYFMVYEDCDIGKKLYFDSITVDTGEIALDIRLPVPDLGVNIDSVSFGNSFDSYSDYQLDHTGNQYTAYININGAMINKDDPPKFSLNFTSPPPSGYTLVMEPRITDITLSKATALKIGDMVTNLSDLPGNIIDNIELGSVDGMLNAFIAEGYFRIKAAPPANTGPNTTYCEGLKVGYDILVEQDSVWLDAEEFEGLNDRFSDVPGGDTLAGKTISANNMRIDQGDISIKPGENGVTFELFGIHDLTKVLPIKLDMDMKIDELTWVRWDKSILPEINIPPIDFANMGGQNVSFIDWIEFNEIRLNIDFTELPPALENHLALKVDCPDLDLNDTLPLTDGENSFKNNPPSNSKTTLTIHDGVGKVQPVSFGVELMPWSDDSPPPPPYLEFGPVTLSSTGDTTLDINAQVTVDFDWSRVQIDLKTALVNTDSELAGTLPKETEEGIDLSEMGKYMYRMKLGNNFKAEIFFSGPDVVVGHFHPHLDFNAQWGDDNALDGVEMIKDKQLEAGELPTLPGKDPYDGWVYKGTAYPKEGHGLPLAGFNDIITKFPQNLRFNYKMELKEENAIIIEHGEFKDDEDNKIRALMILRLPLEFVVEKDGYFAIPSDIFGSSEDDGPSDLFGRENPGEDSLFTGVNIKSLGIKINFGSSLFAGSRLHFDENDILFGKNGLSVGNGNSMNIIFTGEQQKLIEESPIYPDIRFVFPQEKTLRIARNFLPVRIVIAASGSYTLNLDDLLK